VGAVAVWTWVGAVVLALVVLGFCAYEIVWKLRRLGRDVEDLQALQVKLTGLQRSVAAAGDTVVVIGENRARRAHRRDDPLFPNPKVRS
jgi:outer membrane murein-binding lipoprotein Lpp